MLSKVEAVQFLNEILKINYVKETNDKGALLDEIINLYQQNIPYQSITVISRTDKEQHLSTMNDIKAQMFSNHGGLCYDHSVFMKHLLEALGFEVCLNAGDIRLFNGKNEFPSVSKPGDKYYVNVGSQVPFFRAIPLDFDKESPVYKSSFHEFKFVKEGEKIGWWQRVNKSYSTQPVLDHEIVIDGWRKYMIFSLEPKEIDYFRKNTHLIKHWVTQSPQMPGSSCLKTMRAIAYPDQKLLAIKGTSLYCEHYEGNIEKIKITSKEELLDIYGKYFPQLPVEMVEIAADKMKYNFEN